MNFTESFDQFSSRMSTMDLALYAGIGLVLWVLFRDRLSPVQKMLMNVVDSLTSPKAIEIVSPVVTTSTTQVAIREDDTFFKLVASWKQTRDLAVQSGCAEAVKVADQMFPYLSPQGCSKEKTL